MISNGLFTLVKTKNQKKNYGKHERDEFSPYIPTIFHTMAQVNNPMEIKEKMSRRPLRCRWSPCFPCVFNVFFILCLIESISQQSGRSVPLVKKFRTLVTASCAFSLVLRRFMRPDIPSRTSVRFLFTKKTTLSRSSHLHCRNPRRRNAFSTHLCESTPPPRPTSVQAHSAVLNALPCPTMSLRC